MSCLKCGIMKRGEAERYECADCGAFSRIVLAIFEEVDEHMNTSHTVDPKTKRLLQLLADSSFITSKNPQTAIYYKISNFIVSKAFAGEHEIGEEELNRHVSTTRGWGDAFKVFEELGLVRVRTEKFRRVLVITDKTRKQAQQYRTAASLSEIGLVTRLAHIYAGYVLLYILSKVAGLSESNPDWSDLPYHQRPVTLWVTLMFLWSKAYAGKATFDEEELRSYISKRRIASTTRGKIIGALQAMDGTSTQGLIKDVKMAAGERQFAFEDYVLVELERLRPRVRERER